MGSAGDLRHACAGLDSVLGGIEPARTLVAGALSAGIPVITINSGSDRSAGMATVALLLATGLLFAVALSAPVEALHRLPGDRPTGHPHASAPHICAAWMQSDVQ